MGGGSPCTVRVYTIVASHEQPLFVESDEWNASTANTDVQMTSKIDSMASKLYNNMLLFMIMLFCS